MDRGYPYQAQKTASGVPYWNSAGRFLKARPSETRDEGIDSLGQDYQFGLAAAAHPIGRPGIKRTCVVFEAAGSVRLNGDLLVGAPDDRVVRVKGRVGAERDHEASILVRGHPDYRGALVDAEELVILRVGNTGLHVGRAA